MNLSLRKVKNKDLLLIYNWPIDKKLIYYQLSKKILK